MRRYILAALMAATALVPAAAFAQRGEFDIDVTQRRAERQAAREARMDQGTPSQQRVERQPEAAPQVRAEGGERRGNGDGQWRGDRTARGGDVQTVRPDQQAPPQAQIDGGQLRGDRGNRGQFDRRPDRAAAAAPDAGRTDRVRFRDGNSVAVTRGNGQDRRDWQGDRDRGGDRGSWGNTGGTRDGYRNDNRGGAWRRDHGRNNRAGWNRNWRQDDRYDWNQRRQYDRNAYHLPRYYAPSGWRYGYRRFNVGFTLSAILFNRSYWLDDADYYGLPEAYGPYRWVRYYNDALLVDIYTGQVVDTVYDIFW